MLATLGKAQPKAIEKSQEDDVYAMSFIDSQKFSPIHSVRDDHSLEAEQAKQVFNLIQPQIERDKLISLQDDFEPSSSLAKELKKGFAQQNFKKIDAAEMLNILQRLENDTP